MTPFIRVTTILWTLFAIHSMAIAAESMVSAEVRELVPFRLLPLIHTPEVQSELKLSSSQMTELEECFVRLDGSWFRSRIQPNNQRFKELERLEEELKRWATSSLSEKQFSRLKQLELQSLGTRMFLRNDVVGTLKLTASQRSKFTELASATDKAQEKLQEANLKRQPVEELEKAGKQAADAEQRAMETILTTSQKQKLTQMIGPTFDFSSLKRTYPLAPEFAVGTEWINSKPLTLQELRGKVVVVHFYAFQCHNCHANFEIYRRWHKQLQDKGVVVIGIQSPETEQERKPDAVRQAAKERNLDFPIIMDGEMKNWNSWANTMWPTVYVVDKRGYIRHWWQGELNWQGATGDKTIENVIEVALSEK